MNTCLSTKEPLKGVQASPEKKQCQQFGTAPGQHFQETIHRRMGSESLNNAIHRLKA